MNFEIGSLVQRLGSESDYTVGRQGEVIAISALGERCRVNWTHSPTYDLSLKKEVMRNTRFGKYIQERHQRDGFVTPMRPLRTWVKVEFLRKIEAYSLKS